jgi:hypothetical protein
MVSPFTMVPQFTTPINLQWGLAHEEWDLPYVSLGSDARSIHLFGRSSDEETSPIMDEHAGGADFVCSQWDRLPSRHELSGRHGHSCATRDKEVHHGVVVITHMVHAQMGLGIWSRPRNTSGFNEVST